MKKVLLGTSAIALATAAALPASAAEWEMRVGGYALADVGYGDTDVDNNTAPLDISGVDAKWDGEIHFLPSITLDNGIKIGANVQLEGRASSAGGGGTGDVIDEAFVFIDGSFGRVLIGDENSAGYLMTYVAPDVSIGVNSPSSTIFVPYSGTLGSVATGGDLFRGTLGTTFIENERNNDAGRITYFTPRYAGFQLGVSYARDATQNTNGMINTAGAAARDIFDVGANYVNSFGDFDVAISGRWGIASDDRVAIPGTDIGENPQIWSMGANFGYAGFTLGGSFAEQNNADTEDGIAYNLGVMYETGPWAFSVAWLHGENVDEENAFNPLGNDEEVDNIAVGVRYNLAKGVRVHGYGGYTSFSEDFGDAGGPGDDVDGWYIGTRLGLSF